jgi:predicted peptidase
MKRTIYTLLICLLGISVKSQSYEVYLKKQFVHGSDTLNYRIMYPEKMEEGKTYPLILFLHGAGERGIDNESQLINGGDLFIQDSVRANFPAIVIFPQCSKDDYWANVTVDRSTHPLGLDFHPENGPTKHLQMVMSLLDGELDKEYIKKSQVYVMGLSMGGMGTFEILSRKPDTFAGAIAICGAGVPENVETFAKNTPMWIFHGAQDNVVAPAQSIEMVSALLNAGAFPKFTLYDHANHGSWNPAFAEPELLDWLFSNEKTIHHEEDPK